MSRSHGIYHAQYADDTQLYISLTSDAELLVTLNNCFQAVHNWFTANGLALSPSKSEAMVIGTSAKLRANSKLDAVVLGDVRIPVAECVKSLGLSNDYTCLQPARY